MTPCLMIAITVLFSATVVVSAPVTTPIPSLGAAGWTSALPVPVASNTTCTPETGLPEAFLTVAVMVTGSTPLASAPAGRDTVTSHLEGSGSEDEEHPR